MVDAGVETTSTSSYLRSQPSSNLLNNAHLRFCIMEEDIQEERDGINDLEEVSPFLDGPIS